MRDITIESGSLVIRGRVPSNWDEMSFEQLYSLACRVSCLPVQQIKICMLFDALHLYSCVDGIRYAKGLRSRKIDITPAEIATLAACFDFLFEDREGVVSLSPGLTKNPLPRLCGRKGPGTALQDITFEQYQYLVTAMSAGQEEKAAATAVYAALYHDEWQKFLSDEMQDIINNPPQMHPYDARLMMWYVSGSLSAISQIFPHVFRRGGSSADPSDAFCAQLEMLDIICDGDVSKRDAVRSCALYDVLNSLEIKIKNSEKRRNDRL